MRSFTPVGTEKVMEAFGSSSILFRPDPARFPPHAGDFSFPGIIKKNCYICTDSPNRRGLLPSSLLRFDNYLFDFYLTVFDYNYDFGTHNVKDLGCFFLLFRVSVSLCNLFLFDYITNIALLF